MSLTSGDPDYICSAPFGDVFGLGLVRAQVPSHVHDRRLLFPSDPDQCPATMFLENVRRRPSPAGRLGAIWPAPSMVISKRSISEDAATLRRSSRAASSVRGDLRHNECPTLAESGPAVKRDRRAGAELDAHPSSTRSAAAALVSRSMHFMGGSQKCPAMTVNQIATSWAPPAARAHPSPSSSRPGQGPAPGSAH